MYSLFRVSDSSGDSGGMSLGISVDSKGDLVFQHGCKPQIDLCMRVGSLYARSYQAQDWWQTTPVTEILEDRDKYVRFKTRSGSEYVWEET